MQAFLAVLSYVAGFLLILADFYVPSGAILSLVGASGIIYGVWYAFTVAGALMGILSVVMAFIFLPLVFRTGLNHLSLWKQMKNEDGYIGVDERTDLVGKEGMTFSDLRPSGIIKIDGERVDAVSQNRLIEKGTEIVVVKVEGNKIVVRPKS